jgi:hypothetical protein
VDLSDEDDFGRNSLERSMKKLGNNQVSKFSDLEKKQNQIIKHLENQKSNFLKLFDLVK